jgi:hypothetical protein
MKLLMKIWLAAILLAMPVHAAEINDYDPVAANNVARWPEGMTFANVNNSARENEAITARFFRDVNGSLTTGGAANAYTIVANQTFTAYYTGMWVKAQANHTNTGAATLNVDGLGIKTISNVGANGIVSGRIYDFVYDGTNFQVIGQAAELPTGTRLVFYQATCPAGWTQQTTHNNKALRLVSGTGGGTGGAQPFTTAFASQTPSGTVGGTAITEAQMPLHGHPFRMTEGGESSSDCCGGFFLGDDAARTNQAAFTGALSDTPGQQIGGTGGGQTHTHSFTGDAIDLGVQYLDVIICTRI